MGGRHLCCGHRRALSQSLEWIQLQNPLSWSFPHEANYPKSPKNLKRWSIQSLFHPASPEILSQQVRWTQSLQSSKASPGNSGTITWGHTHPLQPVSCPWHSLSSQRETLEDSGLFYQGWGRGRARPALFKVSPGRGLAILWIIPTPLFN